MCSMGFLWQQSVDTTVKQSTGLHPSNLLMFTNIIKAQLFKGFAPHTFPETVSETVGPVNKTSICAQVSALFMFPC